MSRAYSEYVAWYMRYYARYSPAGGKTAADQMNYECAVETLGSFTEEEQKKIVESYQFGQPVDFRLIRVFEKRFAENRRLV